MSSYEKVVYKLLQKAKIKFVQEKTFHDCHKDLYRFDFYLPDSNTILEINGRQHTEYVPYFHKHLSDFKAAQERDRVKLSYCLAHNIPIYCIPYWEIPTLKTAADLFNPKFLAHSKFHNDNVWREYQKHRVN